MTASDPESPARSGETPMGAIDPDDLHVMTFNLRRPTDSALQRRADRWSTRAPAVSALLRTSRPAVLALQEALPHAMPTVRDALGDAYRSLGRGRGPEGRGEGTPLLYDSTRLIVRTWRQEALSDEPDRAGSRDRGTPFPRILVWADFEDRRTGSVFLVVNAHLDPLSARSRDRSVSRTHALLRDRTLPTIVLGDFNASPRSKTLRRMLDGGPLVDAWTAARTRHTPEWGTHANYRRPRTGARRIDGILTTPDIDVRSVAIDARRFDGISPSDHLAVHGILRIGGTT
ncbi:endonuclease/exonuclease/phosphatase family protein [Microbacterium sp. UFMG61]|uniref:endonuclease/exonuclease/phosphatase family protein n=1 Tax=Microbacterium sp. UFMG61 TaxID=2745935 RepID=UPI00188EA985|nr:endonuclease/exonuclease/phosphatase family protein [Microbacterium sp. UFMG61]